MCPACLTALLLTAGGTGSAGGLVALAVKKMTGRPRPIASTQTPTALQSEPQPPTPEKTR